MGEASSRDLSVGDLAAHNRHPENRDGSSGKERIDGFGVRSGPTLARCRLPGDSLPGYRWGGSKGKIRYDDPERLARYGAGATAYVEAWQHIDVMMRGVVQANSGVAFVPLHTKVVLIDGVYRSQLNRSVGKKAHVEVARALVAASRVHAAVASLVSATKLTTTTMADVIDVHGQIMAAVRTAIPVGSQVSDLRSFASKYLHFHAEIAPIYDSYTSGMISRFTDNRDVRVRVRTNEAAIPPLGGDTCYRWYVVRFLALIDHLASLNVAASVKEIDHMLWCEAL